VLQKIVDRALVDNAMKTERLRKAEFILRVPRMHHEFINKYGVNEFIEKFNAIISEYQNVLEESERTKRRVKKREALSQKISVMNRGEVVENASGVPITY
jgi:hypothetical protein